MLFWARNIFLAHFKMIMQNKIWVIIEIVLFSTQTICAQENKVDYIVNKAFEAVGGRNLWENTSTCLEVYDNQSASNSQDPGNMFNFYHYSTAIKLYKNANYKNQLYRWLRIDKENLSDTFSICYDGEKLWSQMGHSEPFIFAEVDVQYSKFVNCGYPTWLLKADSISYSDSLSSIEENYEVLEVNIDEIIMFFFLNRQSFLLDKSYTLSKTITYYSDFREVQGRMVPFTQETKVKGVLHTKVLRSIVKFDIELDDIYFKFPEHPPYNILAKPLEIEID